MLPPMLLTCGAYKVLGCKSCLQFLRVENRFWVFFLKAVLDHIEGSNNSFEFTPEVYDGEGFEAAVHEEFCGGADLILGGKLYYGGGHDVFNEGFFAGVIAPGVVPEVIGRDQANEFAGFDNWELL